MVSRLKGASGLGVLVVLVVAAGAGLLAWGVWRARARQAELKAKAEAGKGAPAPAVKAAPVSRREVMRETVELTGTLRAARSVAVTPEVPGRIEKILVRKGERVSAGQVLALIEAGTYQAQVEQATAAVAMSQASRQAAAVGRDNARADLARIEGLSRTSAVSERDLEQARAMARGADAQLDVAEAGVKQAEAALKLARIAQSKTSVTAPFDGVVADDFNLAPGQAVAPGVPLFQAADVDDLRVTARANERDLLRLSDGLAAEVAVAAHGARVFRGAVLVAGPTVDPMTRTAAVEIAVRNEPDAAGARPLAPGMFAVATVVLSERRGVPAVRAEALSGEAGRESAYVLEAKGERTAEGVELYVVRPAPVTTGLKSGGWVEILGGLAPEALVVQEGVRALAPGTTVRLNGG